jgi:tetratricopeptide (TPR) repeat protein
MQESPSFSSIQVPDSASLKAESSGLARFCDRVTTWTILTLVAVLPLLFLPWTSDATEFNKQAFLFLAAIIAGLSWLGKMLAERKFEYRRSLVNVMVLLFLVVYGISTFTSLNRYVSLSGDFGQESSGFFAILSFVVLYFVVSNHLKTAGEIKRVLGAFLVGGFFVAAFGLLQGLGIFILPFDFARAASFTTVGTVASMGIYLAFIVSIASGLLLADHASEDRSKSAIVSRIGIVLIAVLSLLLISAIDFWPVSLTLLVSSALLVAFAFMHAGRLKGLSGITLPIASLVIAAMLIFFRFPLAFQFPVEITPSMGASYDIAAKTLRDSPLFGSGPGTFIFDYAKHHSPEVNMSSFWNVRFDKASSSALTMLATTGLVGSLSWLLVALFLLVSAGKRLFRADERTWHLLIGIFSAWTLILLAKFLYGSSMTLELLFWITAAMLVAVHRNDFSVTRFDRSPRVAMGASFMFILALILSVSGAFVEGQRYVAETSFAEAVRIDRTGGGVDEVLEALSKASVLNPSNDVFLRNLSLAMFAKADQLFTTTPEVAKNEGETDAAYQERLRTAAQEQVRLATVMRADAANVAKHATEINGKNVANWIMLASAYQGLIGLTAEAETWARSAYESAVALEPANPALRTELGKVIVRQADIAAAALQSQDQEERLAAQKAVDTLLGEASDQLGQATRLKTDYAPAHYQLALVFDRQGKVKEAIEKMEALISLNPSDTGIGFQLALLYFRDERKDDAVRLMEAVVRLQPDFANARWYLAAMYEDRKELDAAIAQIEEVAKLNPDNAAVAEKLGQLRAAKEAPVDENGDPLPLPVDEPLVNQNEQGIRR